MSPIFCCSNTQGYKNRILSYESKFQTFMAWANYPKESNAVSPDTVPSSADITFAIQVVKQTNYGPLDSKRYFVTGSDGVFVEVTEQWLIDANFEKSDEGSRTSSVRLTTNSSKSTSTRKIQRMRTIGEPISLDLRRR